MRIIGLLVLLLVCAAPRAAHAGRSFYGWLYGTEVTPERGVELQTWILEENDKHGSHEKETSLWVGPVIGVTDQLELGLPIEMEWVTNDARTAFTFRRYGIEARYRFASPDETPASPIVPVIRFGAKRDVSVRDVVRLEAEATVSYDIQAVQIVADLGFVGEVAPTRTQRDTHTELRPGLGVSVRAIGGLRVGGELYSELSLDSREESWAAIGPNLSWTHGRFWLSGAFGIGIYHMRTAPRVMWGIAF